MAFFYTNHGWEVGPDKAGADAGGLLEAEGTFLHLCRWPPWSRSATLEPRVHRGADLLPHLHIYIPDALKINFPL